MSREFPQLLNLQGILAKRDKYQFEVWAATRIDGIRPNQKKGRDRGIDGRGASMLVQIQKASQNMKR